MPKKPAAKISLPKKQNSKRNGGRRSKRTGKTKGNGRSAGRPGGGQGGGISTSAMKAGFSIPSIPLFGMRTRRTLRYYASGNVTSGASTAGNYVFSANGVFDPDITGTGGQPMGFDQMMVFYNHYTVLRSRIRLVWQTNSTTLRASVALSVSGSPSPITSIEQLVENGNLTFQLLEYAGAFGGACTQMRSVNTAKFQGIDDVMDDPDMRGDAASNPTEQLYFYLSVWNASSATAVSADFQVFIEYDTMFHEPRKGSVSIAQPAQAPASEFKFEVVPPATNCRLNCRN